MGLEWLLTAGAALVIIAALLAYKGFKGRVNTVGVDLGTTFSVIGSNVNGKVVIFQDKLGRSIFPSIVHYQANGTTVVSYDAVPFLTLDPKNTVYNAKRFIGKSLDDADVSDYADSHPFPIVQIDRVISNLSDIGFDIYGKKLAPEHVGKEVLTHLLKVAGDFLGYSSSLKKVVIAVPAKFNTLQKQATAQAFKLAGLKVVRILEEPTAAAVAYGLHKKSSINYIAVYDFGGGTLDVCFLYVRDKSVQVYAFDGDDSLGGSDFDICLANLITQKVELLAQVDLEALLAKEDVVGRLDTNSDRFCTPSVIRTRAESIKKRLSFEPFVGFNCIIPVSTVGADAGYTSTGDLNSRFKYVYNIADSGKVVESSSTASVSAPSIYYPELSISFNVTVDDFEVFRYD